MSDFTPADYSRCRAWPDGCLGCRWCMPAEAYFCRAYNRRRWDADRVRVEIVPDRRPWWEKERGRKA